jgi:hypothetical protein
MRRRESEEDLYILIYRPRKGRLSVCVGLVGHRSGGTSGAAIYACD